MTRAAGHVARMVPYPAAATHVFTDKGHQHEAGKEPKGERVTLWTSVGSTAWERVRSENDRS
jgi:hypothetical protein